MPLGIRSPYPTQGPYPELYAFPWGGGGAAPGTGGTFAGPIFATEALASAAPNIVDGEQVFILSHRSIWTKRAGVAGTVGVPPLTAHEVIPSVGPVVGVLARTSYSDPALRVGVNDVFIDPANPAANDENPGTAALPLKTGRELFRRWGWGSPQEVGANLTTSPDGYVNVHVVSSVISPDSLPLVDMVASNGSWRVVAGTPTVLRTSTLTAAPTAMNRAAPLGGTRLRLTDAALASWAPFIAQNVRGRFTNGPAAGGTFQPQVNVGGGVVDCSGCQTTNEPGFSTVPTTVTPVNGNTYVIEQLVTVNMNSFVVSQELNPGFGGFNAFISITNAFVPSAGQQSEWMINIQNNAQVAFYQCTIARQIESRTGLIFWVACYWTEGMAMLLGSQAQVQGGGAVRLAASVSPFILWGTNLGRIDNDFVSNGISLADLGANAAFFNMAFWNCVNDSFDPGGHGINVSGTKGSFLGTAWGNGNAGVGIHVTSGASGVGAAQNATGTAGDLGLGSHLGVGAGAQYFNVATGAYLPVAAGQDLTWALITAAKAAPGYGGGAHIPDQNAHWVVAA